MAAAEEGEGTAPAAAAAVAAAAAAAAEEEERGAGEGQEELAPVTVRVLDVRGGGGAATAAAAGGGAQGEEGGELALQSLTGHVFAVDPVTKSVVLQRGGEGGGGRFAFDIVNEDQVESVVGSLEVTSAIHVAAVNAKQLASKEETAAQRAVESLGKLKQGADADTQGIFDLINKILPCDWDGDDIIAVGNVRIRPPYRAQDCEANQPGVSDAALQRVRNIVQGSRNKMAASAPTAETRS